jgi:hypothetical protein
MIWKVDISDIWCNMSYLAGNISTICTIHTRSNVSMHPYALIHNMVIYKKKIELTYALRVSVFMFYRKNLQMCAVNI